MHITKTLNPGFVRYGLIGACLLAMLVTFFFAKQAVLANKVRVDLDALAMVQTNGAQARQEIHDLLLQSGNHGRLYDLGAELALLQSPMQAELAAQLTKNTLARSPAHAVSWSRLAFLEVVRDGKMNADALNYLERSFIVDPAGSGQFKIWRLNFIFSYWEQIPDTLQKSALRSWLMYRQIGKWRSNADKMIVDFNKPNLTKATADALKTSK